MGWRWGITAVDDHVSFSHVDACDALQAAAMREALGIYTTGFGFGLPTDGIHGPNER